MNRHTHVEISTSLSIYVIMTVVTIIILSVIFGAFAFFTKTFNYNNVSQNYERFFDLEREYNSRLSQVKLMKHLVPVDSMDKAFIAQELAAVQMSCINLANTYNADSLKINRELFKSTNLPEQLNSEACTQ